MTQGKTETSGVVATETPKKVKLRKRVQGRENYYLEMPENSEMHIVNEKNEIVFSFYMKDGKPRLWGTSIERVKEQIREEKAK